MDEGIGDSLKIPSRRRQGSMKLPVAPELMRVVVSIVFLMPCS